MYEPVEGYKYTFTVREQCPRVEASAIRTWTIRKSQ